MSGPHRLMTLVFVLVFFVGVAGGCHFCLQKDSVLTACTQMTESGAADVLSSFLFEPLVFLAAAYVFGLTYLGVFVIPVLLLFMGGASGVRFLCALIACGTGDYLQKWLLHWPSAVCASAVILFSAYAFLVSLCTCKLLYSEKSRSFRIKSYTLFFFFAIFTIAVSGVAYCILHRLSAILF